MLFLLPVLALARHPCPVVTCQRLDSDFCAQITDQGFSLTERPLPNDKQCRLFDIFQAYWNLSIASIKASEHQPSDPDKDIGVQCPDRSTQTDFLNATGPFAMSIPKRCSTKLDCEQLNGKRAPCVCGLDGAFYCLPDKDSSAFDFFWEDCRKNNFSGSQYAHFSEWRRWQYGQIYWVMNATAPDSPCANQLLEVQYMLPASALFLQLALLGLNL